MNRRSKTEIEDCRALKTALSALFTRRQEMDPHERCALPQRVSDCAPPETGETCPCYAMHAHALHPCLQGAPRTCFYSARSAPFCNVQKKIREVRLAHSTAVLCKSCKTRGDIYLRRAGIYLIPGLFNLQLGSDALGGLRRLFIL